jgi:dipeptidyl aminopeptidase/acylaminoacyl peptidase
MEQTSVRTRALVVAVAMGAAALAVIPAQKAASAGARTEQAQEPGGQASPDAFGAMFNVHTFQQASISPDGSRVAWVENIAGADGALSSNSAIFVADVNAPGRPMRITAASSSGNYRPLPQPQGNPRTPVSTLHPHEPRILPSAHEEHDVAWSPDGKRIAFLSDAASPGQLQVFVIDANSASAKAQQLTHFKGFVSSPQWSPDGKTVALLYTEDATRAAGPLVAETPDEGVISEEFLEQRLTLVDASTGNARQLSPADMYVYEFDWAPDSRKLVVSAAHGNGDNNWWIAGLYSIEAPSGTMLPILLTPKMQIAEPHWSPDGREIAFIGGLMSDEGITGGDIFTVAPDGGEAKDVTPGMNVSASSIDWAADSRSITFTAIASGDSAIDRVSVPGGEISTLWKGTERISDREFTPHLSLSRNGRVTTEIRQSFSQPPEVWAGEVGKWKQMTNVNAGLTPAWGKAESLSWTTEIGTVQGWLIYPANFDPAKKYPMAVVVHGGPASASMPGWPSRWSYYMALPAQGYFLLLPNPRGSYGEGEKFTEANVKDFGYGDWADILAGADKAIQSAPIDPNRLGLTGWSYGGFMTMWGVTQTNRFRAAVAGAGLSDWLSYYGENKIDQWMIPYFGASVYEDPKVYAKSAPINYITKAKTPTLVVVGDSDGECPAPQSFEFWHALKTLGVPTELVVYPHEGHLFANPAHNRDVMERTIAWFNRYLQAQ